MQKENRLTIKSPSLQVLAEQDRACTFLTQSNKKTGLASRHTLRLEFIERSALSPKTCGLKETQRNSAHRVLAHTTSQCTRDGCEHHCMSVCCCDGHEDFLRLCSQRENKSCVTFSPNWHTNFQHPTSHLRPKQKTICVVCNRFLLEEGGTVLHEQNRQTNLEKELLMCGRRNWNVILCARNRIRSLRCAQETIGHEKTSEVYFQSAAPKSRLCVFLRSARQDAIFFASVKNGNVRGVSFNPP